MATEFPKVAELLILNRQKQAALNLPAVCTYVQKLRVVLRLGKRDFNVCFVDDQEMRRMNAAHRGKHRPTDVLSFPWQQAGEGEALPQGAGGRPHRRKLGRGRNGLGKVELANFLGDVVISAEMARRNAREEGHSTLDEARWLILHGLLHLLGYDHETDRGEMTALELSLREMLGIAHPPARRHQPRARKTRAR